ncbi:MAG TPA: metalloregulator ArsR/SmtB family transcription factor [Aquaticitalea sp.]|nr:metalloregulator ArsR/SmtB family transcription factor [Aquaticitalea sp.]
MRRDVFQAISDSTRRDILHLVSKERMNVNAVAEQFDVSRPAISKHLKILQECGLMTFQQEGRERYCKPNLEALIEVSTWTDQFKTFWDNKLDNLENHLKKSK